jgi:hypothetical protein
MFAVNRTARVPGRIRFLMVSMMTINGINIFGVPCGTRCSNMWWNVLYLFISYLFTYLLQSDTMECIILRRTNTPDTRPQTEYNERS